MNTPPIDRAPHSGWYRIRIKGRLASRWATRFDGMTLTPETTAPPSSRVSSSTRPHCTACSSRSATPACP